MVFASGHESEEEHCFSGRWLLLPAIRSASGIGVPATPATGNRWIVNKYKT